MLGARLSLFRQSSVRYCEYIQCLAVAQVHSVPMVDTLLPGPVIHLLVPAGSRDTLLFHTEAAELLLRRPTMERADCGVKRANP
jgi:hypothetical protein